MVEITDREYYTKKSNFKIDYIGEAKMQATIVALDDLRAEMFA